jgi:hypothetical protein
MRLWGSASHREKQRRDKQQQKDMRIEINLKSTAASAAPAAIWISGRAP